MAYTLVGGRVIEPETGVDRACSVVVEREQIARIMPDTEPPIGRAVDVTGCYVLPGLLDLGCAIDAGADLGSSLDAVAQCAVAGGYTTIGLTPSLGPAAPRVEHPAMVEALLGHARALPVSLAVVGAASTAAGALTDVAAMVRSGAVAVGDIGAEDHAWANAGLLRRAVQNAASAGAPFLLRSWLPEVAELGVAHEGPVATRLGLRPDAAVSETAAVARDLELISSVSARAHVCHLTAERSCELLAQARSRGVAVSASVTPWSLAFDEGQLAAAPFDSAWRLSPLLRSSEDRKGLLRAVRVGTIGCIGGGHLPVSSLGKESEYEDAAPGALALPTNLALMWRLVRNGELPWRRVVEGMTTAVAELFGLSDRGRLVAGARADICVFDPERAWVVDAAALASRSPVSPLLGQTLVGRNVLTICQGVVTYDCDGRTS